MTDNPIPIREIPDHLEHEFVFRSKGTSYHRAYWKDDLTEVKFTFEVGKSLHEDTESEDIFCVDCQVVLAVEGGPIEFEGLI